MFENTIRYNNNNNKHPVETLTTDFDSLLYEAHIAAHNQSAVQTQIGKLADEGISYYIDPDLADFEVGNNFRNESGNLGNWTRVYVQELGDPLKSILEEEGNLLPDELSDDEIKEIAASVTRFQENYANLGADSNLGKYTDGEMEPAIPGPRRIVPWYNKIRTRDQIPTTRRILEASKEVANEELKPCLYTTKDLIKDPAVRRELIDILSDINVDECFLIIENLDKHDTDTNEYVDTIDFVYEISDRGIDPHFMYGDYFSHLLHYFGLGGTTYGTLYGEEHEEETKSYGGGGMSARFYFDDVKEFLSPNGAADVGKRMGRDVCDCAVCSRHFDDWDDVLETLTPDDDDNDEEDDSDSSPNNSLNIAQKHYLEKRWEHTLQIQNNSLSDTRDEFMDGFEEASSDFKDSRQVSGRKDLRYMAKWLTALDERKELVN